MPGSILNADTGFPKFAGTETTEEKLDTVVNYLYMLLEQLRYSMGNLGTENFNEKSLIDLQEMITEPVYIQLEDTEQQLSNQITVTAQGITTRMDQFGVTEFSTTSTYGRGAYVSYGGKFYYCTDPVTTPGPWTGSTNWQETSDASMESQHSQLTQTVNGFTLTVSNNSSNTQSTLTLTSGGFSLSTAVINLSGLVSFTSLADPSSSTQIDGGHITTGTLSCDTLSGGTILGQTISGGTITGATITGGTVTGATVNGGSIVSEVCYTHNDGFGSSQFGRTEITAGKVEYSIVRRHVNADPYGEFVGQYFLGRMYADYDSNNPKLRLTSAITDNDQDPYPLKIIGGNNISIDAEVYKNGNTYTAKTVYIGGDTYTRNNVTYGQQVRIGSYYTPTAIFGSSGLTGASNAWEFKRDGIYFNGNLRVSAT